MKIAYLPITRPDVFGLHVDSRKQIPVRFERGVQV
jgi:hypothetical protein